jgi:hypothetical protein
MDREYRDIHMMTTLVEIVVVLVLLGCIAAIVIAPTGLFERYFRFAEWWKSDSSKWSFRLSTVALSFSIIALVLTLYFRWMDKHIDAKLVEVIGETRAQRFIVENIDSKLGKIISTYDVHGTSLSNIEVQLKELSTAIRMTSDAKENKSEQRPNTGAGNAQPPPIP